MEWLILALTLIGFCLSVYVLHVEKYAGKKKDFRAWCDFTERISCTKAFTSEFAHTGMLPNSVIGMIGYSVMALLAYFNEIQYLFLISLACLSFSVFLAYVLFVRVRSYCLVCISIYAINLGLVLISASRLFF